ncbi:MAG TPA: hypothetical protein VFR87_17965 [Nocardioidaceae bacterium]|nr:hypothetical protein [Nocardioidaceae bacterium]
MRTCTKSVLALTATLAAVAAPLAPASAEPPADANNVTTYHGTWTHGTAVLQSGSAYRCEDELADGRWSVTVKQDGTAVLSTTVFLATTDGGSARGQLHAAWGGLQLPAETRPDGLLVEMFGGATLTISGGNVTFSVPDRYDECPGQLGTLVGTVD